MEEQVIPWLMDRIQDFLREDAATIEGSSAVVNDGIIGVSNGHASAIQARRDAIKKAEADKVEAHKQNEIRKQQRREAREKRAKDEELERFRDTVERNVIFKGESLEVLRSNLLDIHGNYIASNYIGTLGGQLM